MSDSKEPGSSAALLQHQHRETENAAVQRNGEVSPLKVVADDGRFALPIYTNGNLRGEAQPSSIGDSEQTKPANGHCSDHVTDVNAKPTPRNNVPPETPPPTLHSKFSAENGRLTGSQTSFRGSLSRVEKSNLNREVSVSGIGTMLATDFSPPKPHVPDGGWGWVIVFCSTCITAIVGASYVAFSLCYVELQEAFDANKAVTGWIGSIYMATGNFLGIFFSVAVREYGCRPVCVTGAIVTCIGYIASSFATSVVFLYLSFGVLAGAGVGMVCLSTLVVTQQYFDSRRALASGIAISGFSAGTLVAGPLIHALMDAYSWRGALLVYGAIYLHVVPFALLFRPLRLTPEQQREVSVVEKKASDNGGEEGAGRVPVEPPPPRGCLRRGGKSLEQFRSVFDFSLLRDVTFILYLISQFLGHMGITTFYQHTPSRALYLGVERRQVAWLPTMTGAGTGISRILFSFVANAPCTDRLLQYAVAISLSAVVQCTTFLATDFVTIALYGVLQGAINGAFFCIMTTILVDLKGVANVARAQSMLSLALGTSLLLSTPFSGFLFDVTGNYDVPFLVTGTLQLIGGLCGLIAVFIRRHKMRQESDKPVC